MLVNSTPCKHITSTPDHREYRPPGGAWVWGCYIFPEGFSSTPKNGQLGLCVSFTLLQQNS